MSTLSSSSISSCSSSSSLETSSIDNDNISGENVSTGAPTPIAPPLHAERLATTAAVTPPPQNLTQSITPNVETLDLTIGAKELSKKYAPPKSKNCKKHLYPPPNWRQSEQQVRLWYTNTKDFQREECEKWKQLSRSKKNRFTNSIPGIKQKRENEKLARARAPVASRTRRNKKSRNPQKRQKSHNSSSNQQQESESFPKGMAGNDDERKRKADSLSRKGRLKRGLDRGGAPNVAAQYNADVRNKERTLMSSACRFAAMTQPTFDCPTGTPRYRICLIVVNEIEELDDGRPSQEIMQNKRTKPKITLIGHGSSDELRRNSVLGTVKKAMENPQEFEVNSFMENANNHAIDKLELYFETQDQARARPAVGPKSFQQVANNVSPDAVTDTFQSPNK